MTGASLDRPLRVAIVNDYEIVVAPPTDTEVGIVAASGGGLWVNIFERAVGATLKTTGKDSKGAGLGIDAATRGGSPARCPTNSEISGSISRCSTASRSRGR